MERAEVWVLTCSRRWVCCLLGRGLNPQHRYSSRQRFFPPLPPRYIISPGQHITTNPDNAHNLGMTRPRACNRLRTKRVCLEMHSQASRFRRQTACAVESVRAAALDRARLAA